MQAYGMATAYRIARSCERDVLDVLLDLQRRSMDYREGGRRLAEDALFDAEEYYRVQFGRVALQIACSAAKLIFRWWCRGHVESWNKRDWHMRSTVLRLDEFLSKRTAAAGHAPRIVLWAHNSHLGGEWNVGQLMREAYGEENVCIVGAPPAIPDRDPRLKFASARTRHGLTSCISPAGFTTYTGTVMAAHEWDDPAQKLQARRPSEAQRGGGIDLIC
eukprot:tig00021591_g22798.t1